MQLEKIDLPATEQDDLKWDPKPTTDLPILWHLQLGKNRAANKLAVDHFIKTILPLFEGRNFGLSIYRGHVLPTLEEMNALADILHDLIAPLPEGIKAIAEFDASQIESPSFTALLLSKERFRYIDLIVAGSQTPIGDLVKDDVKVGILLPSDEKASLEVLQELDDIAKEHHARFIPEEIANEEWGGLDTLIAFEEALSPRGERQLMGFEAAEGKIIRYDQ